MNSIQLFSLNVRKAISRFFGMQLFGPIYGGELKGYKFLSDTYKEYFSSSYDKDSFDIVLNEIKKKPAAVIYDMGANIGYFSLLCSVSSGSKATIYAFEPIPSNMSILCRHILMNKIENIIPVNLAVSDHLGLVDFSADNSSVSYTYKQSSEYYGNRAINMKVAIINLDTLMNQFNFSMPDVLKIDVEGAEYDVLKGGVELIKKHRPKILLSTHDVHVPGVGKKCLDLITELGYNYSQVPNAPGRTVGLNDYWCTSK